MDALDALDVIELRHAAAEKEVVVKRRGGCGGLLRRHIVVSRGGSNNNGEDYYHALVRRYFPSGIEQGEGAAKTFLFVNQEGLLVEYRHVRLGEDEDVIVNDVETVRKLIEKNKAMLANILIVLALASRSSPSSSSSLSEVKESSPTVADVKVSTSAVAATRDPAARVDSVASILEGQEVVRHTSESWIEEQIKRGEEEKVPEVKSRPANLRIMLDSGAKYLESFDADSTTLGMVRDLVFERVNNNRDVAKITLLDPATRVPFSDSDMIRTLRMLNLYPNAAIIVQRTFLPGSSQSGEHSVDGGLFSTILSWIWALLTMIVNFFGRLYEQAMLLGSSPLPTRDPTPQRIPGNASRTRHLHDLARNQNGDNQYFGGDSTLVSGGDKKKNDEDDGNGEESKKNS